MSDRLHYLDVEERVAQTSRFSKSAVFLPGPRYLAYEVDATVDATSSLRPRLSAPSVDAGGDATS